MARGSKYVKDLKALIESDPEAADIPDLERELFASGSDRALAVLYSSLVEVLIKRLLNAKMRSELNSDDRDRLFGPQGPVGTFSSRIIVAYAFGLIGPDTRFNLDLIREIRNVFAHSRKPLSFDTKQVREACAHLKIPDIWWGRFNPPIIPPKLYLDHFPPEERESASDLNNPRTRFVSICHELSLRMTQGTHGSQGGDIAFPENNPLP
jgi:hypothetical protein